MRVRGQALLVSSEQPSARLQSAEESLAQQAFAEV
jgi:hypothetical protein